MAYVASKGGVAMLTKAMAVDHAAQGIRVNAIAPGPTDTPMLGSVMTTDEMRRFGEAMPIGRLAQPEELAAAALFLASDDASYVTGAVFAVDGGQTAKVGMTLADLGTIARQRVSRQRTKGGGPWQRTPVAQEDRIKTELRENAVGLPGILMQGIATIAPAFAILAIVRVHRELRGIVTPWAYLFGGALLAAAGAVGRAAGQGVPVGRRLVHLDRAGPASAGRASSPGCCSRSGCRRSAR